MNQEVIDYFENYILPIKNKFNNYKCVITGCIGSGKSTILTYLNNLFNKYNFNVDYIHEYLEADPEYGQMILSKFINKQITNMNMQLSILDIYEHELIKHFKIEDSETSKKSEITLFERIPDDNLTIFSAIAYVKHPDDIDNFGITYLYNRTINLNKLYNLPSYIYKDSKTKFKLLKSNDLTDSLLLILQTIHDDICNNVNSRIIGLSITLEICKLRIKRRGRENEDKYTDDYLNSIINTYQNIYDELEKDDYNIRLINIGKFIDK